MHNGDGLQTEDIASLHKAIIRYSDGRLMRAFVPVNDYLRGYSNGSEVYTLCDTQGVQLRVEARDIKAIFLVKSFEGNPNYVEFKNFPERPGDSGLWVRVNFNDRESLEGVAPNALATFCAPIFLMTPPDPRSNNQAVMVSKASLTDMRVLGFEAGN